MVDLKLRKLSDDDLIHQLQVLVKTERETTHQILCHLREVEFRRLFSKLGFPSLFAYAVEGLKYSDSAAQRRISAMRLLKSLEPDIAQEVEAQIERGGLTLCHLSQAQSFFNQEAQANHPFSQQEKKEILNALVGTSARDAAEELQSRSTQEIPPIREYTRAASHGRTEIHLVIGKEGFETLDKVRGLLSHAHPHLSWGELIEMLATLGWEKLDPAREPKKRIATKEAQGVKTNTFLPPTSAVTPTSEVKLESGLRSEPETNSAVAGPSLVTKSGKRVAIPAATEREVWRTNQHQCTYVNPKTGRACGSRRFLEIEHLTPVALGGTHHPSNLTLRCRSCNARAAIDVFGLKKMSPFLSG